MSTDARLDSAAAIEVRKITLGLSSHLRERAYLVSLVAYIDESYDDGGMFVLGGHVASVERWEALSAEWEQYLPKFARIDGGDLEFKMRAMMQTPERIADIQPFFRLIENYVEASISICFNLSDWQDAMRQLRVGDRPIDWALFGDRSYFAYRCLMDTFHSRRDEMIEALPDDAHIDFVFDELSNAEKILACWSDYIALRDDRIKVLYGERPIFRRSSKFMPLQAADLWAGWVRICEKGGNRENIRICDFGEWKGKSGAPKAVHVVWSKDQIVSDLKNLVRSTVGNAAICQFSYDW